MKTFFQIFSLSAALFVLLFAIQLRAQDDTTQAPPPTEQAQGDNGVSFQTFYNQLASQGTWIQTDQYGYVFQPTENDPNWRPYTYGHWVSSDAGMTWVSDEPFGWATYHYGRWVNLNGTGWVWVPGYTWAPAWVSWRTGADDVGWAPLPPDSDEGIDYYGDDDFFTDFDLGFGFHIGDDCDLAYGIGPWCYNFCPIVFFGDRDCWRHFRDHRDNFAFIGRTRNVTNINFRRDGGGRFGRVTAQGPSVAALNGRTHTSIENVRLASASRLSSAGLHGNTLSVFAPRVDPATFRTARPGSVSRTLANTTVNRGTDINRPLAVNSRISPAGASAEQIHAATLAQANTSSGARVATTNTRISRPLSQPLTSLRTNTRTATFGGGGASNRFSTTHVSSPSVSTESRFTGEAVTPRSSFSSSAESRYTGEPVTRHESFSSSPGTRYMNQGITPSRTTSTFGSTPSYSSGGSYYHPSSVYHTSTPVFHSSAPSYYHPQASFHSFAPASQPHFNSVAPLAHYSGGGFSGGRTSGGGGAVHASGGGSGQGYGRH